jgi:hypothetical protein
MPQIVPQRIDAVGRDVRVGGEIVLAVKKAVSFQQLLLPLVVKRCRQKGA